MEKGVGGSRVREQSGRNNVMGIEEVDKSPLVNCSVVHFQIDRPTTMAKQPVRMKAVVYALSPFQQKVMSGLWKDLPGKIKQKVSENWLNAFLFLSPLVGTYAYVQQYKEKEKLAHRY